MSTSQLSNLYCSRDSLSPSSPLSYTTSTMKIQLPTIRVCDESRPDTFVGEIVPSTHLHTWARRSWIALLAIALAASLVAMLTGCKHTPPVIEPSPQPTATPTPAPTPTPVPTPEPTPTPTPESQTFAALRLTAVRFDFVRESDPTYQMRKCVACCADTQGTGWPGLTKAEIDFLHNQGLCNLVQWRVGPFTSRNEPEWVSTGGGAYVEDPATGKADLSQFNQPYWDALRAAVVHAGELGMNVEVSVLDGWSAKTQCWRSNALPGETCAWHPWHRAGNIQGQDHLTSAWQGTSPNPIQLAYILKIYDTVGDLQNVIFEDGTEPDQLVSTSRPATEIVKWSLTQEALLRQTESIHAWPSHLYGSNFVGDASYAWLCKGRLQYQNIHRLTASATPVTSSFFDASCQRPIVTDEINFEPAASAVEVESFACYARANGSYWAAWRHEQDTNQWLASLSLIAQDSINGCSEKMKLGCPFDVPEVSSVSCKPHGGALWDCTPRSSRGPILQEGHPSRALCEQVAASMGPGDGVLWGVTPISGGAISTSSAPNRWQFRLTGTKGATGTLKCKLPKLTDACGYTVTVQ